MSTLQNTAEHHHWTRTRTVALCALIALGLALLVLIPTGHGKRAPTGSGVTQAAAPAALAAQYRASAGCFRDPGTHALTCSHAAPHPDASGPSTVYFRDPATHQLLGMPARQQHGAHQPSHPSSGGVAP